MKKRRDLFHDIGSNVYSLLSSHLISQLEIENESELVAASLVACH